ncbi:MAG: hypothetical protein C4B58_16445 [Deltaproteobacteria bacterium]|nr:MAG: hypothetical protein C4B58_16445 [Deltaproteobacteria bacterium]
MNIAKDKRLEQAARWLVRSQDKDFTPEDKKRMTAWLDEAPANREAFEEMRKAWKHIGVLTPVLAPISIHPYKAKKFADVKAVLSRFKESKNRAAIAMAAMAVMVLLCLPVFKTYFFEQAVQFMSIKPQPGSRKL